MTKTAALIPIGLVEDDTPFRDYVGRLLEATGRFHVVLSTPDPAVAWREIARVAPRLLLLDLRLPGVKGAEAVARCVELAPETLVVMLTGINHDDALLECLRAGATGYLVKGVSSTELVAAVDEALDGGAPMSPGIARRVLGLLREPAAPVAPVAPAAAGGKGVSELSPRELEVLTLVAEGLSDKEIARRLDVALSTVKNHLSAVYGKWRVRSRTEAVVRLVQPPRT